MKSSTGTIVKKIPKNNQSTSFNSSNEKSFASRNFFGVAKYDKQHRRERQHAEWMRLDWVTHEREHLGRL
jgi:hypothetical protein